MTESPSAAVDELFREYGDKTTAVEPGGVEEIPLEERHGKPISLLYNWVSPNMEFATIFVGALGVLYFGLSFWQAAAAIIIGNGLGGIFHAVLTSWGPKSGLCQMVLSRKAFGFIGNLLPAGLNSLLAGCGWFAVNAVSGALALSALTGMSPLLSLIIGFLIMLAAAVLGHNFIHFFEKWAFPLLAVIFLVGVVIAFSKAAPSTPGAPVPGAFWIAIGASFGYTAGWNPLAADYARYLKPAQARPAGLFAALGVFLSSTVLQVAGAAAVTAVGVSKFNVDNPAESYIGLFPTWLGKVTLLGIFIGAIAANQINLYSSALS